MSDVSSTPPVTAQWNGLAKSNTFNAVLVRHLSTCRPQVKPWGAVRTPYAAGAGRRPGRCPQAVTSRSIPRQVVGHPTLRRRSARLSINHSLFIYLRLSTSLRYTTVNKPDFSLLSTGPPDSLTGDSHADLQTAHAGQPGETTANSRPLCPRPME